MPPRSNRSHLRPRVGLYAWTAEPLAAGSTMFAWMPLSPAIAVEFPVTYAFGSLISPLSFTLICPSSLILSTPNSH